MALNASGPIALAGATAGVSIALELSLGTTTAISLNQAAVRTLAGVPSGAIIMPTNFYGKSNGPTVGLFYGGYGSSGDTNLVTRINACGALVGSQTNAGTARESLAGAKVGSNGLFYGGYGSLGNSNLVTRINACGTLVGSETNVGTSRSRLSGALIGTNGVYFGGCTGFSCSSGRVTTKINACGALVGSEVIVPISSEIVYSAAAPVGSYGLYRGIDITNKLNSCGTLVAKYSRVGTGRFGEGASSVGSVVMFYGGLTYYCCCGTTIYTYYNTATRVNACGALVGSETNVGTARGILAGSKVVSNALFYGGATCSVYFNKATRINACGALVGSETTVGTARESLAGASV